MTTITEAARHPALVERLLDLLRQVLAMTEPPPAHPPAEDIDWEDGEPETEGDTAPAG